MFNITYIISVKTTSKWNTVCVLQKPSVLWEWSTDGSRPTGPSFCGNFLFCFRLKQLESHKKTLNWIYYILKWSLIHFRLSSSHSIKVRIFVTRQIPEAFLVSNWRPHWSKRTAFFSAITQRVVVISYRRFGTTYHPIFESQESVLDSCRLEFLTLQDVIDRPSRNVGKKLPLLAV